MHLISACSRMYIYIFFLFEKQVSNFPLQEKSFKNKQIQEIYCIAVLKFIYGYCFSKQIKFINPIFEFVCVCFSIPKPLSTNLLNSTGQIILLDVLHLSFKKFSSLAMQIFVRIGATHIMTPKNCWKYSPSNVMKLFSKSWNGQNGVEKSTKSCYVFKHLEKCQDINWKCKKNTW